MLTLDQQTQFKRKLNPIVEALVGKEMSVEWWDSPNKAFGGKTPSQIVGTTEYNQVKEYLMFHAFVGGGS